MTPRSLRRSELTTRIVFGLLVFAVAAGVAVGVSAVSSGADGNRACFEKALIGSVTAVSVFGEKRTTQQRSDAAIQMAVGC